MNPYREIEGLASSPFRRARQQNWRIRPDSNRHGLDRQSSALAVVLRIPWLREPDLNRRLRFMRPADCCFPIPRQNWCMWEDSNLRCSPLRVAVLQTAAVATEATHAWRSVTESNSHPSREPPGSGRIASPLAVRSSKQTGGWRASQTLKSLMRTSRFERGGLVTCPSHPWRNAEHSKLNPCKIASASNEAPALPGLRSNRHEAIRALTTGGE